MRNTITSQFKIRKAIQKDARSIRRIQQDTWLAAYVNEEYDITPEDIKAKEFLSKESIEKTYRFLKKNLNCWVAEVGDQVVGLVWPQIQDGRRRVGSIYILPKYQGMGIGSKFMVKVFEVHKGYDIYLDVVSFNKSAIRFYEKFGFKRTGKKKDHPMPHGKVIPTLEMRRRVH